MRAPAVVRVEPFPLGAVGGVAGRAPGRLPDLRSPWPLAVLVPRTGTTLGMEGEECGNASERAV